MLIYPDKSSFRAHKKGNIKVSYLKIPLSVFGLEDGKEILCRRSRLTCSGYSAWKYINPGPALVNQERFELDPYKSQQISRSQYQDRLIPIIKMFSFLYYNYHWQVYCLYGLVDIPAASSASFFSWKRASGKLNLIKYKSRLSWRI